MLQRVRQLTVMWLILILALLPVSGHLLAVPQAGAGDALSMSQIHMQHADMNHSLGMMGHHDVANNDADASMSSHVHDCHNGLCAGSCGSCVGCHAPPVQSSSHSMGAVILAVMPRLHSSMPPPGIFYRPPQTTTA